MASSSGRECFYKENSSVVFSSLFEQWRIRAEITLLNALLRRQFCSSFSLSVRTGGKICLHSTYLGVEIELIFSVIFYCH